MHRRFSVPVTYVNQLLQQAGEQGFDVDRLLTESGIDRSAITQHARLDAEKFGLLYQKVMYLAQDEFFGLLSGGKAPLGAFRMMCHAILHCSTLEKAIYRASAFHELCRGIQVKPKLRRAGHLAHVSFAGTDAASVDVRQLLEQAPRSHIRASLAMWHSFICWLTDCHIDLTAVYFNNPKPEDHADYQSLFQTRVRFGQHDTAMVFPAYYLDYPLVQTEASLRVFLKTAPYPLIARVANDSSLKSKVAALLDKQVGREVTGVDQVAERLHMSASTLRRRLQEEGTTFQNIKDECRLRTAISYLNAPQMALNDISRLMGFTEPSAFFRSFKKWTGMTPSEYRRSESYRESTLVGGAVTLQQNSS